MEPRAATPEKRLNAIAQLADAGVPTAVMAAPIIPGLNDPEIESILEAAYAAGAREAGYVLLRLPLELKEIFREWLATEFPDRAQRILSLLDAKEHLTQAIHVKLPVEKVNKENLEDLRAILERHKGDCKAYVHLCTDPQCEAVIRLGDRLRVKPGRRLIEEVNKYFSGEVVSTEVANGPSPVASSRFQNQNNRRFPPR